MTDSRVLSVSMVVFHPDLDVLRATLESLGRAADRARATAHIGRGQLWVVDNGDTAPAALDQAIAEALAPWADWWEVTTLRGHGNVGYGAGHNLAIAQVASRYHLILNPDVLLDADALVAAIQCLDANAEVGLVAPRAVSESGERQYLCKRYPSVAVLGLRGFAPGWLRRRFAGRLARYEMRDLSDDPAFTPVPIASGCFMVCRTRVLTSVGGFASEFFLYFEDFDLSLRLGKVSTIAYVPGVRIVHAGGEAAAKGWAHRRMFIRSGLRFFRRHGWSLF